MEIFKDQSIKSFNTFSIDVKARFFAEIFSEDDFHQLLNKNEFKKIRKFILGGGSNVLFTKYYDGIIIKNSIPGIEIMNDDDESVIVEAGAGVIWDDFVKYCVDQNWADVENLSLIPGTVGAAPIQNIGAYGQELQNVLFNLEGILIETGEKKTFGNSECKFGYRDSIFKNELKDKFIITLVRFKLCKKPANNISYPSLREEVERRNINNPSIDDVREIIISIRNSKLPDPKKTGNAGSFFKNPVLSFKRFELLKQKYPDLKSFPVDSSSVKLSAAALIEKCGWKGKRIGNCGSYEKQPLVLVNYGGATADEILNLADSIKSSVEEKFDVSLEPEVNLI